MEPKLKLKDLPEDWYTRYGDETVEQLAFELRHEVLHGRKTAFWRRFPFTKDMFKLGNSSPEMTFRYARELYNVPALCYLLEPSENQIIEKVISEDPYEIVKRFRISPYVWMKEDFIEWVDSTGTDITCDNKDPFAPVLLQRDEYRHFEDWFGLGLNSSLDSVQAQQEAQERDLANLIQQHSALCDIVHEKAHGPWDPDEEALLSQIKTYRSKYWSRVLSPICRAVLLLTTVDMKEHRRVLIVLTGDNSSLMSTAPTFSNIPQEEIFAYRGRGQNVVEVPLATAIRYLRHLDDEEEKVNDVLRSATNARSQSLAKTLHDEANEKITEWSMKYVGHEIDDWQVEEAMRQVLERNGELRG